VIALGLIAAGACSPVEATGAGGAAPAAGAATGAGPRAGASGAAERIAGKAAVDRAAADDRATVETTFAAAYRRALSSRRWEPMLALADACARRAAAGGAERGRWVQRARRAYLTAFVRARRDRAVAGLLGAAAGFADLGDAPPARLALEAARRLAGPADPVTTRRMEALAARLAEGAGGGTAR